MGDPTSRGAIQQEVAAQDELLEDNTRRKGIHNDPKSTRIHEETFAVVSQSRDLTYEQRCRLSKEKHAERRKRIIQREVVVADDTPNGAAETQLQQQDPDLEQEPAPGVELKEQGTPGLGQNERDLQVAEQPEQPEYQGQQTEQLEENEGGEYEQHQDGDFVCDFGCGYCGSYDEVEQHEVIC